jgi:hypothetical protein
MPGATFARTRIASRFLTHTYTRLSRGARTAPPVALDEDEWGNPLVATDTDPQAPASVAGVACLYIPRGGFVQSNQGLVQVETPTLLVAWNDPLQVGDEVRNVADPTNGTVLQAWAAVKSQLWHAPSGPVIWQAFSLLEAESD